MSELRQRVDEALCGELSASFLAETGEWTFTVDGSMVDAALRVFAAWLRERADEDPNEGTPVTLRALARELDPPKGDDRA